MKGIIEVGDLVQWHNNKKVVGIVTEVNQRHAFVYWFIHNAPIMNRLWIGGGWEPNTYLKILSKSKKLNKSESSTSK